jgi:hypothetical protein
VKSTITFAWREPGVVECTIAGHVDGAALDDATAELQRFLGPDGRVEALFVETGGVTGFDPDVAGSGRGFLGAFQERGVQASVAVAPNGLVRMMGSAIALATGLSMRFFGDRDEALVYLEKTRAKRRVAPG